jgi:hypothetical protein
MDLSTRENILKDINNNLKDILEKHGYKNNIKWYIGRVENNNDPLKLGRCKIRVIGEFGNEINTESLPWSNPDFNFIGGSLGSFIVPPNDSLVRVYFENNDIYRPLYTTKVIQRNEFDNWDDKDESYPDTMIFFEDDLGSLFKINRKTGEATFRHSSGMIFSIDKNGNCIINNENTSSGKLTISSKGDIELKSIKGNISLEASKGKILLGGESATMPVPNVPISDFSGSPHAIGLQINGTPGAVYLRP